MSLENSYTPPRPSASTQWALTAIWRETQRHNKEFSPSQIAGQTIRLETAQNGSGSSPLFAARVMRVVRAAAGREATYRRQKPAIDPQHKVRQDYHTDAHAVLQPLLTQLAHQIVDGVNGQTKTYTNKFFVQPPAAVPERAVDDHTSTLTIMTHPKEAQFLITQGIGSFAFNSHYAEKPENRGASVGFQAYRTELNITPGDGFYPDPVKKSLSRKQDEKQDEKPDDKSVWKSGQSLKEVDAEAILQSVRGRLFAFMEKFNPEGVAAYKETPEAKRPLAMKKAVVAPKEELVMV